MKISSLRCSFLASGAKALRQAAAVTQEVRNRPADVRWRCHRHTSIIALILAVLCAMRDAAAMTPEDVRAYLLAQGILSTYGAGPLKARAEQVITQLRRYSNKSFVVYPVRDLAMLSAHAGGFILLDISSMANDESLLAFRLAHEWGHLVLGHQPNISTPYGNPLRPRFGPTTDEDAADIYAARFLAEYGYDIEPAMLDLRSMVVPPGDPHSNGPVRARVVQIAYEKARCRKAPKSGEVESEKIQPGDAAPKVLTCPERCDSALEKCKDDSAADLEPCIDRKLRRCINSCVYATGQSDEACRVGSCSSEEDQAERSCESSRRSSIRRCESTARSCREACQRPTPSDGDSSANQVDTPAGGAFIVLTETAPDAKYTLNGRTVEATTLAKRPGASVPPGSFSLAFEKSAGAIEIRKVGTIQLGQVLTIDLPYKFKYSYLGMNMESGGRALLAIRNPSADLEIYVNGRRIPVAEARSPSGAQIAGGPVSIQVNHTRSPNETYRLNLYVPAGTSLTVDLPADMTGPPTGRVVVENAAASLRYLINGHEVEHNMLAAPQGLGVPAGSVSIEIRNDDQSIRYRQEHSISAGQTLTISPP